MTKLNMASVNTLIRKGYILAGVLMAANMFIVNEVKATEKKEDTIPESEKNENFDSSKLNKENQNKEATEKTLPDAPGAKSKQNILVRVLSLENTFNLIGGVVSSVANNYFKWWNYNAGTYREIGCLGWKSKRFLYGVLQFEVNFNLGRGVLWSIPNIITLIRMKTSEKGGSEESKKDGNFSWVRFFFIDILRGFTSMPFTFHISKFNFSISISLDSIIWMGICKILELKDEKYMKKSEANDTQNNEKNNEMDEKLISDN